MATEIKLLPNGTDLKKDGFWFESMFRYRDALHIKDAIYTNEKISKRYIDYMNETKINKMIIDTFHSDIESLEMLVEIPHIEYLRIRGDIDYTPLYMLKNLKLLQVSGNMELDLKYFPNLESLSGNPKIMYNIDQATSLKSLELIGNGYPPKYNDFSFLEKMKNLDTLVIKNSNITNMDGIDKLKKLKVFISINNKKLENIDALLGIKNSIKHLVIDRSNKIENFDIIKNFKKLIYLKLKEIKLIPNINFITDLKSLKTALFFDSNIIDGNLTPLLSLEEALVMPMKRHYFKLVRNTKVKCTDDDLNYGHRYRGDEDIELWRRTDY